MTGDSFWISQDGTILSNCGKKADLLEVTVGFEIRDPEELEFLQNHLDQLHFSERSRLARAGIELFLTDDVRLEEGKLIATAEAFVIDPSFPTHRKLQKLLQPGIAVGRLFFAPAATKLNSMEIWDALNNNQIKLPETVSIDRLGEVHFTPHRRIYTLPKNISETDLDALITGDLPRAYLDQIQTVQEVQHLTLQPGEGILTSCSMYLSNHYAVLRRVADNFGLHTCAVLLDPGKTFGTNVMLEIYNASDGIVVNPVLSLEIYRASSHDATDTAPIQKGLEERPRS